MSWNRRWDADWFFRGCLFEAMVLFVALLLGWTFDQPLLALIRWNGGDALLGGLACLPLLILFRSSVSSPWAPLARIRQFLEQVVRPTLGQWSPTQLAVISVLAGVSEEILFRGFIQGLVAKWNGPALAIAVSSVLFGLCHAMTRAYALIAGLIGAYLGALCVFTGNLLTPIVAHALYDFVALLYFLRVEKPGGLDSRNHQA